MSKEDFDAAILRSNLCPPPPPSPQVCKEDFDAAILRSVAGIEKKRSILRGAEKDCVAKHEVGGWVGGWVSGWPT